MSKRTLGTRPGGVINTVAAVSPVAGLIRRVPAELVVFTIAVLARLVPVIRGGGFYGNYGYDPSVYYAAADALLHGRLPYRDFVLLHPPGMMLVDTPFAVLGRLTTDNLGFAAANMAFTLVGGVNAVLVTRVAGRMGLDRRSTVVGGVVYALWCGAVASEYLARLEPLGNLLVLCGLLAFFAARESSSRLWPALSGIAFGLAVSVKVWWFVALLVLLGWQLLVDRAPRRVALIAASALAAGIAVDGPFLLAAPSKMLAMSVIDQVGRLRNNGTPLGPLGYMSIGWPAHRLPPSLLAVIVAAVAAMFAVLCWRAWRTPSARMLNLLVIAQLVQLIVEPSWFSFYADFVAVSGSLTIAAAATRKAPARGADASDRSRARVLWLPGLVAIAMAAVLVATLPPALVTAFPTDPLADAVTHQRCVMSDSPMGLIELNVLSRDLTNNCPNWVDVTGRLYGADAPVGNPRSATAYRKWNQDINAYLRSGDALMFMRSPATIKIGRRNAAALESGPALATAGHYTIYRTLHSG